MDCPYAHGTQEFYRWWALRLKLGIKMFQEKQLRIRIQQKWSEATMYGHSFGKDRICDCGLQFKDYANVNSDERWRRKQEFTCVSNREINK